MIRIRLKPILVSFAVTLVLTPTWALADDSEENRGEKVSASTVGALRVRSLGPALMSGRIADFAVNPHKKSEWIVAVCSGGVWKTTNNGTTFTPVFDGQGSYSIGCAALDPSNPNVVWVGTGENNSQRSVSFGDGVYKSVDGGKSWKNLGLKDSEHIGMIAIDPRDSDVVYVAAQGPLWRSGGDRGLYKTTDGGKSWNQVLFVSENTGINEVHLDPRNPDTLYASSYQRRRRVWTLINGGPESAIYKSTDAGATWQKLTRGLPGGDKGRIGMDISPANPDVLYAIVEAADGAGGFYRSQNRGITWSKRSSYMTSSPQYYNEVVCDPEDVDRVYVLDTFLQVSEDGGARFRGAGQSYRHVDDHALWIDPSDPDHLLVGSDGGIYESWDRGSNWSFKANLPVTQFYKICLDNSEPFYYVYGGTQDNNTQGGPTRTTDRIGIANEDWFITVGGDGFEPQVDPEDPNIVYSQWQYGGLIRHDRRTGEIVDIKPREKPGEEPYVWNWDSPLLISPHSSSRLYYGADKLFRSDNRGNSWTRISEDLTREIDRNRLPVMGKIQKPEAVSKNRSTSIYGNTVALSESPLQEHLLYVGTDDGLIHVTEDAGGEWEPIDVFPGVPHMTYVSYLFASRHEAHRVYAAFDNHKNGDFKPYLLRSDDRGKTWDSIVGDLPEREICWALAEDHVNPDLLFVGTEFGAYFTIDGGEHWTKVPGLPTIAVRDLEIQRRENDVVFGTFGRGFYVLDDYSALRDIRKSSLEKEAAKIFPIKDAYLYVERSRLGGRGGRGYQGASLYSASNPSFGAVFTYYVRDKHPTKKEKRLEKQGKSDSYPSIDTFREEDEERPPRLFLTVKDSEGNVVRHLNLSRSKGLHRTAWDLRYPTRSPIRGGSQPGSGHFVLPGTYSVSLSKELDGEVTELAAPVSFDVVPLPGAKVTDEQRKTTIAFQRKASDLLGTVRATQTVFRETQQRLDTLRTTVQQTPGLDGTLLAKVEEVQKKLRSIGLRLNGDRTLSRRYEPSPPSISGRAGVATSSFRTTSPPTQTHRDQYAFASEALESVLEELGTVVDKDLPEISEALEKAGAPWTPGRMPTWNKD